MKNILNIILILMMVITAGFIAFAVMSGGTDESIGAILLWTYTLLGLGLVAAIACAVMGMTTSPGDIKGTVISIVLGAIVIGASYLFATGHTVLISDISNGGYFPAVDTVITESSMLVIYAVCAASVAAAVFSEIWGAFK